MKYQRNLPTAQGKQAEVLPSSMEYKAKTANSHGSSGDGTGSPNGTTLHRDSQALPYAPSVYEGEKSRQGQAI